MIDLVVGKLYVTTTVKYVYSSYEALWDQWSGSLPMIGINEPFMLLEFKERSAYESGYHILSGKIDGWIWNRPGGIQEITR